MMRKADFYTVKELAGAGPEKIPSMYQVTSHLVFSSPATLAYNSPGAEGFGVKRAGLAIPDSVMLIVAPGCCGRNTSMISSMPQYKDRFFYLQMDETDLVTGRHLKVIPQAVDEVVNSLEKRPSLVMICATCADALLGTDWERVCRQAQEKSGVKVRPCYMYALTREGVHPPMVHVRQSLYSLLEKKDKDPASVNLLGFFSPLAKEFELFRYLKKAGVKHVRQISTSGSFPDFLEMARANFNIVLNPECRSAADDLADRLGMPYVELVRFYDPERIHRQYSAFSRALGLKVEDEEDYLRAQETVKLFSLRHPSLKVSIGECANSDPFELALALTRAGIGVKEIFATVTKECFFYLKALSKVNPEIRVYCNQDPSMLYYGEQDEHDCVDLTIGKDAAYYHPQAAHVNWNQDEQPFGYAGAAALYAEMERALDGRSL